MQNFLSLILIAFFVYLLFFRKGGMGCCGGHDDHSNESDERKHSPEIFSGNEEDIIDLKEDQYTVTMLPAEDKEHQKETDKMFVTHKK